MIRRRCQFSLRSVFVLFVLVGVPLGWLSQWLLAVNQESASLDELRRYGEFSPQYRRGRVVQLAFEAYSPPTGNTGNEFATFTHLEVLGFYGNALPTDESITGIAKLPRLKHVRIRGNRVSDAGVAQLATLKDLQSLFLAGTSITDDSAARIAELAQLESLNLSKTSMTDVGAKELSRLTKLTCLWLNDTEVTDLSLEWIARIGPLQQLGLDRTRITDDGLGRLEALTKLESLDLSRVPITDRGLAHIATLPNLQVLQIHGRYLSDEGLERLAGCVKLRTLNLTGESPRVTTTGIRRLSDRLSGLEVTTDAPVLDYEAGVLVSPESARCRDE